jgi:predicted enzyme related to lactoylglutathione lyase
LKHDGVEQVGEMQAYEYGKFAHIIDIEGNKVELWEPKDAEYDKTVGENINP